MNRFIFFLMIFLVCMLYLVGTTEVYSLGELTILDIGVFVVTIVSFFGMLNFLPN